MREQHPRVPSALDELARASISAYGYVPPAPRTFSGRRAQAAGGPQPHADLSSGNLRIERHWRYLPEPSRTSRPSGGAGPRSSWSRLDAAVARRLVAAGGAVPQRRYRSSTVVALAMRHVGRDRQDSTFSIAFDGSGFDESAYAQIVARHIGGALRRYPSGLPGRWRSCLGAAAAGRAHCRLVLLLTFLVSRFARRRVTVAPVATARTNCWPVTIRSARCVTRAYENVSRAATRASGDSLVGRLPVSHRYMSLDFRLKRTPARAGPRRAVLAAGLDGAGTAFPVAGAVPGSRGQRGRRSDRGLGRMPEELPGGADHLSMCAPTAGRHPP